MLVHLQDLDQPYEFPFAIENQIQMQHMSYFAHRKKTKTKEFTFQNEQQAKIIVHHAVMWLLIDAPMAWICRVRPRLPEFMITYQLELLRNVFAQHEAVSALEDFATTDLTLKMLMDLLKNDEVYYGVRCHVARALAKFNSEQLEFKHMNILLDWYEGQFFVKPPAGQAGKPRPKPHDFHEAKNHFVQLEVIKSLSICRDSQNYTPVRVVELLIHSLQEANNNSSNMYNDDYYNAEVELALGRIRPETDQYYSDAVTIIQAKLALHATIPSFCNIISSAGYLALTAIALKTDIFVPPVGEMRAVVLENTNHFEARASVFRDLLFLALARKGVLFEELVADVRWLVQNGYHESAALCLKEIHRLVHNSLHFGDENKFETYLLALPEGMTKEQLAREFTGGDHKLEIVETLWEILAVFGQHHRILRSEAFRTYVSLYGEKLPYPYEEKIAPPPPFELTADRSNGCMLQIDMPRPTRAQSTSALARDMATTPKKMKLKLPEGSAAQRPGSLSRSPSQMNVE
jgi:transcription initiation factor TFIID subunit 2